MTKMEGLQIDSAVLTVGITMSVPCAARMHASSVVFPALWKTGTRRGGTDTGTEAHERR